MDLLETLSVTNLNSTRKFPQNGIEVANYYFVSKVHVSLIQIEVLFSKKCPFGFPLKYHNFCSFPKYFQSRKGLSMLMPIFKVTGRAKSVWSILNFLKVTYARHTIAWRKPKLMQDLNICMFDYDFKKKIIVFILPKCTSVCCFRNTSSSVER